MLKRSAYSSVYLYLAGGFGAGILFFLLHYSVVFNSISLTFSFNSFFMLHKESPLTWLIDFLPVAGIFSGVYLHRKKMQDYFEINSYKEKFSANNKKSAELIRRLANGETTVSIRSENPLSEVLNELKENLKQNKNREKLRNEENYKRNWTAEGMAKFSGILREDTDDLENLSFNLIKELVKYLDANQGGFFITEEDTRKGKYLKLLSCYAYDRKKFADKEIPWNEGLIGSTAMEKQPLYLENIPENYLEITSGLGKSNPRNLLISPLIFNDEVKGMLEIASFNHLEKYQIEFVNQVSEIIAMTLANIFNAQRTEMLLQETRLQARKLAQQEEKVRQNMDKLKSAQEVAAQQAEKFITFSTTVNHTLIRAEFDVNGILLYANTKFIRKLGYSGNREVEGKHISMFIDEKDRDWFNDIWDSLAHGGAHFEGYMKHLAKNGQDVWTMATYTCVRSDDGSVEKILFLAIDNTEQRKQSLDYESQIEAINRLSVKAEFLPDGKLVSFNDLFINSFRYTATELKTKSIFDLIDNKDFENFNDTWQDILRGQAFQSQIRMLTKFHEEKWFRSSYTAVNNMYGEVSKVIFLGNEITNEKIMENESRKQTEFLKSQEEKYRLENLNLRRELKNLERGLSDEKSSREFIVSAYRKLLNSSDNLNIIFDNNGELLFTGKAMANFLGLKSAEIPKNTAELLGKLPEKSQNEFWLSLFDPSKPVDFKTKSVNLVNSKGEKRKFHARLFTTEEKDRIINLVSLNPA